MIWKSDTNLERAMGFVLDRALPSLPDTLRPRPAGRAVLASKS